MSLVSLTGGRIPEGDRSQIPNSSNTHSLPTNFLPAPPTFPYSGQTFFPRSKARSNLRSQGEDPLYIHFLPPLKLLPPSPPLTALSPPSPRPSPRRSETENLEVRTDGNGAAAAGVRGRHGRHALLLPLDLPGPGSRPAPTDGGGGAEAEPADGDGGAGGDQGGAAAEGPDHRQARRPRAPGGQGAGRGAGQGAAARASRQASAGSGACAHPAAGGPRAGHVQRHRLRLQPRLVPRGPLLRPRHLLRPAPLRQAQPAPAAQAEARRGRGARHARGEEAAAAAGPVPAVRHGGRPAAAEPARRRAAPAVAQPAARARARRAPRRRRRPRTLPQRDAPPRGKRAGLRSQRLHDEAADARRQLLAGIQRQAAQAALTLHHRPPTSSVAGCLATDISGCPRLAAPVAHWHRIALRVVIVEPEYSSSSLVASHPCLIVV